MASEKDDQAHGTSPGVVTPSSNQSSSSNSRENRAADGLEKADSKLAPTPRADNPDDVFAHLPTHEADILKRQTVVAPVKAGFLLLYRYSSRNDLLIMVVSAIASIVAGAALPLMTIIFGNLQGTFQDYFLGRTSYDDFTDEMSHYVLYFVYLAIGEFVSPPPTSSQESPRSGGPVVYFVAHH